MSKSAAAWPVADAKARLSEMIARAISEGPQTITRHGQPAAVVVSVDAWRRRTRLRGNLVDFLAASPLAGSGLKIERAKERPRPTGL